MIDLYQHSKQTLSLCLIDQLPGMFYRSLPEEGFVINYVSKGCLSLTGYSQHDILYDTTINYRDIIYPPDQARINEKFNAAPRDDFYFVEEYHILCVNGQVKWVKEIAKGIYNRKRELKFIEGYIVDIGREKREDQELNSFIAYQKAVDTAAIVSITDIKGWIVYANDFFCEISKFTRKELVGQNHRIINSGFHSVDFFADMWLAISAGKIWHGEIKNKAKDGSYYWVDTTISPIFDNHGHIVQYLSIRSLITSRKNLEQEREKLIGELNHKYNELMQFNYIVSHNIRAPIANLISLTDLLAEECERINDNAKVLISYMTKSVLSVDEVIKDLTQILSARNPIHKILEKINFYDIIESVESSLEKQITESGTVIKIDIDSAFTQFESIKSYIQSIFYNIISNAIKYSKSNQYPHIFITIKRISEEVQIKISDNGVGIDLDKVGSQIFGLYKKFDFTKEGRGLGLHMTKAQIESLGGKIEVTSSIGIGTTFTINLPYTKDSLTD